MSAVIHPEPPAEVLAVIEDGIRRLCDSRDPMYRTLLDGIKSGNLLTQAVYTVDLNPLLDMRQTLNAQAESMYRGWRFIAGSGKAVAAGYVAKTKTPDGWKLTSVSYGSQLDDSVNAPDPNQFVADLPTATCELRVLEIPVLNLQVLWYVPVPDTQGEEEWIVPLSDLNGTQIAQYERMTCTDFRETCRTHLDEFIYIEDPDPMPNGPLEDGEVRRIRDYGG